MANVKIRIVAVAAALLSLCYCNKSEQMETSADTNTEISSAAKPKIDGKTFATSAQVDLQVRDVYEATLKIENNVLSKGGYVAQSRLYNELIDEDTQQISEDKAVVKKKYQAENDMVVKVPSELLPQFLKETNEAAAYQVARVIEAEDVTTELYEHRATDSLQQKLTTRNDSAGSTTGAIDQMSTIGKEKIENRVSADRLKDRIRYSTVSIHLQNLQPQVSVISIENNAALWAQNQHALGYDIWTALSTGAHLFYRLFIFLVTLWPLWLLLAAVIFAKRKGLHRALRFKSKKSAQDE